MIGALVDDEAHRPFRRMGANVNDRALKAAIGHCRHRDKQLPFEFNGHPLGSAFL